MASPRYKVATVGGDIVAREGGTTHPVGLSAHVLDRQNAHKVVATFRSEDQTGGGYRRGHEGATLAAVTLAAEWNADERCNEPTSA